MHASTTAIVCSMTPLSATSTVLNVSRTRSPVWLLKRHVVPVPPSCGGMSACQLQARDDYFQSHSHWNTDLPRVWAASTATPDGTALWQHHYTVPASCVYWLPPTLLCSLCTGYLVQYTCFHPRFWHPGHLQNCSENPPLQLRLQATPLTVIHWRLRFTFPWHMAPTK